MTSTDLVYLIAGLWIFGWLTVACIIVLIVNTWPDDENMILGQIEDSFPLVFLTLFLTWPKILFGLFNALVLGRKDD